MMNLGREKGMGREREVAGVEGSKRGVGSGSEEGRKG